MSKKPAKPRRLVTLKKSGENSVRRTKGISHDTTPKSKSAAARLKKSQRKKGDPALPGAGAKRGVPQKMTLLLKDAIVKAAEIVGNNGRGRDGLVGYLARLAVKEPKSFAGLLGRVLPYHITARTDNYHIYGTREEVINALHDRGLPIDAIFEDVPSLTFGGNQNDAARIAPPSASDDEPTPTQH